jgi:SAM-dependent methyltransferase
MTTRGSVQPTDNPSGDYSAKISAELERYAEQEEVHDLPAIYHFWSERYCLPLFRELGFTGLDDFFDRHVAEQCKRRAPERARLVSLGAGNGDTEIGIAERLRREGIENLELVLLELNPQMLERALADARAHGIEDRVVVVQADLNEWCAHEPADVYFANHSLHHIVALEHVFAEVTTSLHPEGVLLVNDMIGRNGHMRWPEAADLVRRVWAAADARYRMNPFQRLVDDVYPDIDCSTSGFEGIRAQDILPLMLERFYPDTYVTFLNVADPFIDRIYGPNFDINKPEDLAFIDALGRLDDAVMDLGLVTPTHLVGSFRKQSVPCRYPRERSPERTLRLTDGSDPRDILFTANDSSYVVETERVETERLADLQLSFEEAWGHYHHLRQRKAVRAALALAALRSRLSSALQRRRAGG